MKFSYNWLSEYVQKIPPAKQLVDDLTMRAFEIESIEKKGSDWVLDVKILSNRAFDCFSYLGMAQEIAAISDTRFKEPIFKIKEEKSLKIKDLLSVEVKEPKLCPRYSARVIFDIKVGSSPKWLQERIEACGLRPINNIVDITNYVMLETGQPLHAFDLDKLNDGKIIIRRAKKGEKIITLDEGRAERILDENILVIADAKKPIAIAGIKGGKEPEIDNKTKRVALEAANFNPLSIRKSSRALGLRTDASWRFENGVNINLTIEALNRAAEIIRELAGGKIASGIIDVASAKKEPWTVGVKHSYIESLLGLNISSSQVLNIFSRLNLPARQIKKGKDIFYEVKVPARRADLLTSEDLIEEIGRLFGYENIPAKLPSGVLIPAVKNEELIYADNIRDILVGLGYSEVYNYSFIADTDEEIYRLQNLAEISNPLSNDQKYLRPNLATGLIKNLKDNLKYFLSGSGFAPESNALRFFEIGHVFFQNGPAERGGKKFQELIKIGGIAYLKDLSKKDNAFFELKGLIDVLFNKLGLVDQWDDSHIQEGLPSNWKQILHLRKTAQIKSGDRLIGWVGELHPKIASELKLEGRPAIFELDFSAIAQLVSEEHEYQPPSKFPAITRDLAILVEQSIKTETVLNIIENAGGDLLIDVDLFDIYEGEDLSAENKSLAFHLIFQSSERNLSDAEVNKLMEKIIKAVEDEGWEVRK